MRSQTSQLLTVLHPRAILVILLFLFVLLAAYYSVATPILEAPDENWHYQFVREVAVNHGMPVVRTDVAQPFRHEGLQPPLYYVLGAGLIAWTEPRSLETLPASNPFERIGEPAYASNDNRNAFVHSPDERFPYGGASLAIHLIRLLSVALGAVTVLLTYFLALEILAPPKATVAFAPSEPMGAQANSITDKRQLTALFAAAFVAFLPQFLFISGVISNDTLTTTLAAAVLLVLARMLRLGINLRSALVLSLLTGAALLSKTSALALLPVVFAVVVYLALKRRAWLEAIKFAAVYFFFVALIAGWWYLRNLSLYGELFPLTPLAALVGARPTPLSLSRWFFSEGEALRLSLWGVFGWFNVLASPVFYLFYDLLALGGIIGIGIGLVRRRDLPVGLGLLAFAILAEVIVFWRYASVIITTQGRLLFPVLPAWAILWAWGLSNLLPSRFALAGAAVVTAALFISAFLTPSQFIVPAYTPTIVADSNLPSDVAPLYWRFDNGVQWLGASHSRADAAAGVPIDVTIYSTVPVSPTASALFIHVLNSADVIVAQRDSYIGSGNVIPTGSVVKDTFRIQIPVTAPIKNDETLRVEAGMYNPTDGVRIPVRTNNAEPPENELTLTTLQAQSPDPKAMHFDFDGRAALVGVDYANSAVAPGNNLSLTLNWQNFSRNTNYHVFVHALGDNDHIWASADSAIDAASPTHIQLAFDPATPPGVYPLELGVYQAPDGDRLAVLDANSQDLGDRIFVGPIRVTQ